MQSIIRTKNGVLRETTSWKKVSEETANVVNTLHINGIRGAHPIDIYILQNNQIVSYFKKQWRLSSLWLVGFQRVNKRIKTCDVIWLLDGEPIIQSIDRTHVDKICNNVECNVYMCGLDPLPWKKFHNDAKRYGWKIEDWCHLLSEDSSEEDDEDSDWKPDEDDLDEDDLDEDDLDEEI